RILVIEMATRVGKGSAFQKEALIREQCLPCFLNARRQVLASGFARRRTAPAASQKISQGDACSAPDSLDLMFYIAEECSPMKLVRLLLPLNGMCPVELLHDSSVTQYQFAVRKSRWLTHTTSVPSMSLPRGVSLC